MNTQAQHLLEEALKLPVDTREDLAMRLLGSVELTESEAAVVKQAWIEETDCRVAKFESGESTAIPIEDAWPTITGKAWKSNSSADE